MKRNFKVIVMTLAILATMTGCGSNVQTDNSEKTTTQVSVTTKTEVAPTDSSETDTSDTDFTDSKSDSENKTDTTDDSKSDSSSDESKSEKATTTTKSSKDETKTEKTVTTTTKQSSTTTSAIATQPVATKATAKPIVTTKATQKPTVTAKQTTKATTKATPKVTTKAQPTNVLAGLPDYKQALGRCILNTWTQADLEIIRKHYLEYGQKLAPRYVQDKNLTYFIDPKTGKGTNDWKPYFNPQNPPNASMTCQEPKPIARGYNALGSGNILEQIKYADNDLQRIVSQGLNYYNWKTADSSWELAWYIQFGYVVGGKELYFLCISQAR